MGASAVVFIVLTVFVVFTLIIGGGITFYQDGIAQQSTPDSPVSGLINQVALIVIMLMFIGGALLFLAGAARWVARNR